MVAVMIYWVAGMNGFFQFEYKLPDLSKYWNYPLSHIPRPVYLEHFGAAGAIYPHRVDVPRCYDKDFQHFDEYHKHFCMHRHCLVLDSLESLKELKFDNFSPLILVQV